MKLLIKCVTGIEIMNEEPAIRPGIYKPREWIREAEKVCFLGFGYHPTNVRRLPIDESFFERKEFFGTAKGLKPNQLARAAQLFGGSLRVYEPNPDLNVLDFLRTMPVF